MAGIVNNVIADPLINPTPLPPTPATNPTPAPTYGGKGAAMLAAGRTGKRIWSQLGSVQEKAAAGDPRAQARMAANDPNTVNTAWTQYQQMAPQQRAQYLQNNPYM